MPPSNEPSTPRLTYFGIRARAEVIRLILEETGTPYRERRIGEAEWPALKPTMPFEHLPIYEEGELLIPHSHAIYRYLARKHDLYGGNESERIRCDVVNETFVDAQNALGGFYWRSDFADKRDEFEREALPRLLATLERLFLQ